jgi:hypothetical protein
MPKSLKVLSRAAQAARKDDLNWDFDDQRTQFSVNYATVLLDTPDVTYSEFL